jgi:putative FmdB family regulatory protein
VPYHEYKCRVCGQYFQRRVESPDDPVACLKCGSRDLECVTCGHQPRGIAGAALAGGAAAGGRSKY